MVQLDSSKKRHNIPKEPKLDTSLVFEAMHFLTGHNGNLRSTNSFKVWKAKGHLKEANFPSSILFGNDVLNSAVRYGFAVLAVKESFIKQP